MTDRVEEPASPERVVGLSYEGHDTALSALYSLMERDDSQASECHSLHVIHSGLDSPESSDVEEDVILADDLVLMSVNDHPLDILPMFEFCTEDVAKLDGNNWKSLFIFKSVSYGDCVCHGMWL